MGDFNVALVIVAAVVSVLVLLVSVYLLVNYQHPDDANQAWFPKLVVVLGITVAVLSILMLPADVANRQACKRAVYSGACALTLPMKTLWLVVYIIDAVLVFLVIPFAMFYYEGDQDKSVGKRLKSALIWVVASAVVCGLILGILYALIGKVDFTVRHLSSSVQAFPNPNQFSAFTSGQPCIAPLTRQEATELGKKAKELKKAAEALHQEERSGNKGRKWRKNVKAVEKELLLLENDMNALEEMYPQGEKAEATWAFTVLAYIGKLIFGIVGLIVSIAWVAHIIIYLLVDPPLSSFLNEIFIKLDSVWGLLGTAAFAFFCFYLLIAVIAGEMMLGLKLVFITIHPMKWGGTLMNSFLFNVGLILLCSISVIQFCATAFAYYAQATAAQEIFGHTLQSLRGIKYLYKYNVFQYGFVALAILTLFYYALFGWRKRKPTGRFQLSN
ncbi:unnamed protein product [Triticum turgidum subsp. durum]|uniref:LIMR family protein n=1 Tax=Triticum turgidum subsp. durum TaxID=4567 RepID=A0A9R1BHZ7_TRITD|nr:unnamed protein product [Triticum turgidum subsp. durum]